MEEEGFDEAGRELAGGAVQYCSVHTYKAAFERARTPIPYQLLSVNNFATRLSQNSAPYES